MPTPAARKETPAVSVRPMEEKDSRRIFRLAFGAFMGVPDPENFWADREIHLHTLADGSGSRSRSRRERQIRRLECCNELGQFWLFRSADSTPRIVEAAN